MAWIVRSERESIIPPTSTPAIVGPGAYDATASSIKTPRASFAPFTSTTERAFDYISANQTAPGPGAYGSVSNPVKTADAQSTPFVSQVSRFQNHGNADVPGPGAYYTSSEWGKRKKPLTLTTIRRNLDLHPQEHGRLEWVRLGSVPSIPTVEQSYGFVESRTGNLKPQPPPKKPTSELTKPMFSAFTPKPALSHHRSSHGPAFGKAPGHCLEASLSQSAGLEGVGKNKVASEPGPGQYEVTASRGSFGPASTGVSGSIEHSSYLRRKPLSVFSSNVKRTFAPQPATAPGPGTYTPPSSFEYAARRAPLVQQCFGSRADRNLRSFGSDLNTTPGPGAYSGATAIAAFPGGLGTDLASLLPSHAVQTKPTSTFKSAAPRFEALKPTNTATPGPGQYGVPAAGVIEDLARKQRNGGRNRSFGTTSSRFISKDDSALPGPGAYEPPQDPSWRAEAAARPAVTKAPEFIPPGVQAARARNAAMRAAVPAPGSYNLDLDGEARRKLVEEAERNPPKHFLSSSQRFDDAASIRRYVTTSHLGPGRYNAHEKQLKLAEFGKPDAPSAVFKSSTSRFEGGVAAELGPITSRELQSTSVGQSLQAHLEVSETPGPGAYSPRQDLIKHSYNVTIEASTVAATRRERTARSRTRETPR